MVNPVGVTVLLVCLFSCCHNVFGWGRFGFNGGYQYNLGHHHNGRNNNNDNSMEEPTSGIIDVGDSVGRFRRQNTSAEILGDEGRLNSNLNTCTVSNNRVLGRWRCDNGQIIDCNGLCNGGRNCGDGSDETVIACRHVFCLDSAFRCAYGGCIRSEMECNGVQDCADGSDERTINCPGVLNKIRANGNCNEGFFQCKSGECVYDDGVCSGGAECPDGSDETAEVCSTHFCPEPAFRCDYGACVPRMARCDGKRDCVDGSDEKPEVCLNATGRVPEVGADQRPPIGGDFPLGPAISSTNLGSVLSQFRDILFSQESQISQLRQENLQLRLNILQSFGLEVTRTKTSESFSPIQQNTPKNPQAPMIPQTNPPKRPLDSDFLDSVITRRPANKEPVSEPTRKQPDVRLPIPPISTTPREEGDCDAPVLPNGRVSDVFSRRYDNRFVKNGEEIIFQCLTGTSLIGANSTYCINGMLLHDMPLCTNQCSGLPLNTLSVQAECFEPTGVKIPCSPLLPPKTIAILTCKIGYKRPDRVVPDAYTCMDDGNWNAHVYKCIPICGEVTEGRRLIVGGEESNITQVPWHAGIYESFDGKMEQICGGSIINPTAVVTAAHCFWDQQRKQMKDAGLYGVAVGKTLRDFDADEPTSQRYKVATIRIYEQYMDYEGLYVSDIAVVLLDKPIIFQSYIKPICVEYSLKGNQRYVVSGIQGRVAGWGLTDSQGVPSPVLKTIDLPTVDFNTCLNESPASFKPFITTDKFCGGFTNGQSVCRGDSGGGLAFPMPSQDKSTTVYFLRGIVSVGPILQGSCDNTKYSAFTDIQLHNLFLYDYLFV